MEIVAEGHGDATDDEAGVVEEETVHPLVNTDLIWYWSDRVNITRANMTNWSKL